MSASSLFQTEVTTVICGQKELKKLVDISGQLDTVKRVICMDEIPSSALVAAGSNWTLTTFSDVEKLGQENPVDPDLPLAADIAVIMYTSGSTGLPKVNFHSHCFKSLKTVLLFGTLHVSLSLWRNSLQSFCFSNLDLLHIL